MGRNRTIQTLNSAQDLSTVSFGHKFPRHGLKLLHWLANDWIRFNSDGTMSPTVKPDTGSFGFHPFHNKELILPELEGNSSYFELGNLHAYGADSLPFRQAEAQNDESNMDRIIVRMDRGYHNDQSPVIGMVYITEHIRHLNTFRAEATYCISRGLIKSLKSWSLSFFLQKAGYIGEVANIFVLEEVGLYPHLPITEQYDVVRNEPSRDHTSNQSDNVCCVLL